MSEFLKSWLNKWDKVIVFAGIFDPVHKGHLAAAEAALKLGKKVVFLPERIPQHKQGTTDYAHRLEMLKLATSYNSRFEVLDYPNNRQYIKPVFEWLASKYPTSKFVWLVGSDVIPKMKDWPDIEMLEELEVVDVVFVEREGHQKIDDYKINKSINAKSVVLKRRWKTSKDYQKVSSNNIRSNFKQLQNQLPEEALKYAIEHKLYG